LADSCRLMLLILQVVACDLGSKGKRLTNARVVPHSNGGDRSGQRG